MTISVPVGLGVGQVPLKILICFQSFITPSSDHDANPEILNLRYYSRKSWKGKLISFEMIQKKSYNQKPKAKKIAFSGSTNIQFTILKQFLKACKSVEINNIQIEVAQQINCQAKQNDILLAIRFFKK